MQDQPRDAPLLLSPMLGGLSALLFFVDLNLPLGVSAGGTYVIVVLLAAWHPIGRRILVFAALGTILTIAGFFWSPPGGILWMAATNRSIAIAALWAISLLAYRRRCAEDRLQKANEELDAFVHTVSHNLRSPLTPILGYAEILKDQCGSRLRDTEKAAIETIDAQGNRMLNMLNDLLRFATIGHSETPTTPVDADRVLSAVADVWRQRIEDSGGSLLCGRLPPVPVEESLLYQIFDNLVGNATRYAPGCEIEVGGEREGSRVRFFVRDHGPGIPPEERAHIFEPFRRGASGRPLPGTGIGLATVCRITTSHGGRAWVEETPGGGSTFFVEIGAPRTRGSRRPGR